MKTFIAKLNFRDLMVFGWYGGLAALVAYVLLWWQFFADQPFHSGMFFTYNNILAGQEEAPYQYRYFAYLLPVFIKWLSGYSLQTAEAINRVIWLWASALALHLYLTRWFERKETIIGTLAFLSAGSLFVVQTSFAPSDLPTFFFLLLGLIALQRRAYRWLLLTVPTGMLFRETSIFIFLVWAIFFIYEPDKRKQLPYIIGAILLAAMVFISLRVYFGFKAYDPYTLPKNLSDKRVALRLMLLFNVFWIAPWLAFRSAPRFMKYTAVLVPVVFVVNMLFTLAKDSRLWLPLVPALIPLGLIYLLDSKPTEPAAG